MTHIWHKMLAKRDIGNIWDRRSNGTYDFVYLVSTVLESVVDGSLIDQGGEWNSSSEVRCDNWVPKGKFIRMSGFEFVLLSVWTWWGAWVQRNVYCWGLDDLLWEKEEEWRLVLGEQNEFVVGSIFAEPNYFWAALMFQVPRIMKFEVVRVDKNLTIYFDLFVVEQALELLVKKPLGRVQKAGEYLRFLG